MKLMQFAIVTLVVLSVTISRAEDFHTTMMRATVKLQHDKSTGTGFVLRQSRPDAAGGSRSILITAAHVFERTNDDKTTVVYRTQEAEGVFQKQSTPLQLSKEGQPLWAKHPTEDVAVIVVTLPEKADIPEIATETLASDELLRKYEVHPGQTATCLGYPHRVEGNEAGFPILRAGAIASYPLIPSAANRQFMLSANTFEGDSGGPIYLTEPGRATSDAKPEEVRLILGLMHGQHFLDEEMTTIYGNSKQRHRLGLGIVIQAAFIRETIERLP
jgi:Trypsin-like peptidase domain